jgi:hypothetical protein
MAKLLLLLLVAQLPYGLKPYKPGFSVPRGKVVAVEKKSLGAFTRGQKTAIVLVVKQDCRGCRQMEKRLEKVAKELREFRFSVLDEAESKRKWQRLPALVLYRDGREADRRMGVMSQQKLEDWILGEGR